MKVLILAEHKNSNLKSSSLELVKACAGLEVSAVILGADAKAAAETLTDHGVANVFWLNDPAFNAYHSEAYASAVKQVIDQTKPSLVLATASAAGKDLLPKLAAMFNASILTDCVEAQVSERKFKKPYFSGKAIAQIQLDEADIAFVSLRANSLSPGKASDTKGRIEDLKCSFDFASSALTFKEKTESTSDRPDLAEANVVVSGGRSLKSKENFKIIFDCADAFGGAAGASRAAVDEGLAPHDMQVGQTGKTVNPNLYVACGISGAIQHLAGMRTSRVIVAINKDANAPIFGKADYGIVGDLFEVVPLLTEEVKKKLGKAA